MAEFLITPKTEFAQFTSYDTVSQSLQHVRKHLAKTVIKCPFRQTTFSLLNLNHKHHLKQFTDQSWILDPNGPVLVSQGCSAINVTQQKQPYTVIPYVLICRTSGWGFSD